MQYIIIINYMSYSYMHKMCVCGQNHLHLSGYYYRLSLLGGPMCHFRFWGALSLFSVSCIRSLVYSYCKHILYNRADCLQFQFPSISQFQPPFVSVLQSCIFILLQSPGFVAPAGHVLKLFLQIVVSWRRALETGVLPRYKRQFPNHVLKCHNHFTKKILFIFRKMNLQHFIL